MIAMQPVAANTSNANISSAIRQVCPFPSIMINMPSFGMLDI